MSRPGITRTLGIALGFASLLAASPAGAAVETCAYNAAAKTVTATITPGSEATLAVAATGEILFGLVPEPCGAATSTNTDAIQIAGLAGTHEKLTIDESAAFLGPGAATETNFPEIEVATALGDASDDVVVLGTAGNDSIAMGQNGLSLNSDGDVDVTFAPLPAHVEIRGGGGKNVLTGRGGWGAGPAFTGQVTLRAGDLGDELNGGNGNDVLEGGAGDDTLNGNDGDDQIRGYAGSDRLSGGAGKDFIVGGSGADNLIGGAGNDFLVAFDGEADNQINGGPDVDAAFYDPGLDPTPGATESAIPGAPVETCEYNATTQAITARLEPGTHPTLKVSASGQILFGVAPAACGAATSTNTDSIQVSGAAGVAESLTVDLTDGPLGPGATTETNHPEIELAVALGDAADPFVVLGSAGDDTLVAGLNGVSLNNDGDLDVTFNPLPATIELRGGGGVNFLTGRGGFGAGLAFPNSVILRGGDLGDELNGGNGNDLIVGGAGNDVVSGSGGDDEIRGGGGNDRLVGSDGNDFIVGGLGADELVGGEGDDVLDANDDFADISIHGGAGADTAFYDAGIDPPMTAVEIQIPDPGEEPPPPPPPPPAGTCVFRAADKAVVASMPEAGEATIAVVGSEIRFGLLPVACGAATTANTDSIEILGVTGVAEKLTLDQTAGVFAPGATAELNFPEIEIAATLGDAADELLVLGTDGDDSFATGLNGLSLNPDGDVDVTFGSTLPGRIEIDGRGGRNVLTGRGGWGAGLAYAGVLVLRAGDLGDELSGGEGNDLLVGGAGADVIAGNGGNDQIHGGAGADKLSGSDGNDTIVGGSGADELMGGSGDDVLEADDGEADTQIHGGAGIDTAYVDDLLDPPTIAVEFRIPR